MAAVTYSAVKYDPMYCLNEHLEYFNENVVGDKNFLEADFDEIFGKDFMANIINDDSLSTPVKESVPSSPIMAPASPKSVMTAEDISRQANVVSPTTVATPTFSEESVRKIEKPKPKASRKRTISETSSEASSSTPKDQEDVRR